MQSASNDNQYINHLVTWHSKDGCTHRKNTQSSFIHKK